MGCDKCFGQVSVSAGCMCALPASDYINGNKAHMQCCSSIDNKFMLRSRVTMRSKVGPVQVLREYSCRVLFCSQAAVSVQSSLETLRMSFDINCNISWIYVAFPATYSWFMTAQETQVQEVTVSAGLSCFHLFSCSYNQYTRVWS